MVIISLSTKEIQGTVIQRTLTWSLQRRLLILLRRRARYCCWLQLHGSALNRCTLCTCTCHSCWGAALLLGVEFHQRKQSLPLLVLLLPCS